MAGQLLLLIVGVLLLTGGAEGLVRGGSALARRMGLTPLVIGLTVVAFGTSAPELVVSVKGALGGYADMAVGNVVGSNIFNVGVVLGVAALVAPMRITLAVIRVDTPLMIGVSFGATVMLLRTGFSRSAGLVLLMLLVAYTYFTIVLARKETAGQAQRAFACAVPGPQGRAWLDMLCVIAGLGGLPQVRIFSYPPLPPLPGYME